jgi:hypothetical protein
MKKFLSKKTIISWFGILVFLFAFGIFAQTFAQDQDDVQQAQEAVRSKIVKSKGGTVTFPTYSQVETYPISNKYIGVRGYGTWMPTNDFRNSNDNINSQDFSYDARVESRKNKVSKIKYTFLSDDDWNGRIPSWAVGTFYGRNPQTGGTITLTINNNGSVGIKFDNGRTNYATLNGDRLLNSGITSRITRINNGIRTTRLDNGEQIDYFTNINYNTGGYDTTGGNVPDWAIGTFTGRNPQSGGNITLTISSNGSVAINFGGANSYATMNGDRLTNNGVVSRVTRINNGIRTTRLDNGEQIDYFANSTGNNNRRTNRNRNAKVPSWAVGTFNGRNPQTGGTITLTITNNGDVTINMNGSISYATIEEGILINNGIESNISKISNGIRTIRIDNGERIDYRRQ